VGPAVIAGRGIGEVEAEVRGRDGVPFGIDGTTQGPPGPARRGGERAEGERENEARVRTRHEIGSSRNATGNLRQYTSRSRCLEWNHRGSCWPTPADGGRLQDLWELRQTDSARILVGTAARRRFVKQVILGANGQLGQDLVPRLGGEVIALSRAQADL